MLNTKIDKMVSLIDKKGKKGFKDLAKEMKTDENTIERSDRTKVEVFGGKKEVEITTKDSSVKVFVIPTDEERVIVEDTVAILEGTYDAHTHFKYSFLG